MGNCNPVLPRSHINLLLLLFVKGRLIDIQFLLSSAWLCNKVPDIQQSPPGYSWKFLVEVCRPVLQILTLCQTKKCHFPHPFSDLASKIHTRFQTWRWSKNAALHVYIKQKLWSVAKCRGSWVVGRGRGSWVWVVGVGVGKCRGLKKYRKIDKVKVIEKKK